MVVGTEVRLALKRFFESSFPRLAVLSYQELPANTEIESAGIIASMPTLPRVEPQPQLKAA
jgi:flagellar biosynthesis protein FlhA